MALADLVFSPAGIFTLALAAGYLIYCWAQSIAPPFKPSINKVMPYVGGEPATAQIFQPGYLFFYVALFFTVVHVAAMVIAIAPPDAPLAATLGYLALVVVGITILRWEQ